MRKFKLVMSKIVCVALCAISCVAGWSLAMELRPLPREVLSDVETNQHFLQREISRREFANVCREYLDFLYGNSGKRHIFNVIENRFQLWIYKLINTPNLESKLNEIMGPSAYDAISKDVAVNLSDPGRRMEFEGKFSLTAEEKANLDKLISDGEKRIEIVKNERKGNFGSSQIAAEDTYLDDRAEPFSYENIVRCRYTGDSPDEIEFSIDKDIYGQYEMKGKSRPDAAGDYTLFYLLADGRILHTDVRFSNEDAISYVEISDFDKLTIDSDGFWSVSYSKNSKNR
ncbi:MAG: hypothetical protein LUC24_04955 [Bacteroidales bacterium]|nr:hypothetical protein [Bacteroidales bacterium]MCD8313491.1 hypothetical protein [Bacteroidales bacterium]